MSYDSLIKRMDELNSISSISSNNYIAIFSQNQGSTVRSTISNLSDYIQGLITTDKEVVRVNPLTGTTTSLGSLTDDIWMIITPTGTIATYEIVTVTSPVDQQEINVNTTQEITSLTLSVPSGASTTIIGSPTTMSQNDFFTLRYDSSTNVWYRVG